jgi:hypothetical protein
MAFEPLTILTLPDMSCCCAFSQRPRLEFDVTDM